MRWIIIVAIAALLVASVVGFFPREAAFFVLGVLLVAVLLLPLADAVWVSLVSIPLSPALPLEGFDTFAVWRVVVVVLFVRWVYEEYKDAVLRTIIPDTSIETDGRSAASRVIDPDASIGTGRRSARHKTQGGIGDFLRAVCEHLWKRWEGRTLVLFVAWAAVSLFWAPDWLFGARQVIFLLNALLLLPIVISVARRHRLLVEEGAVLSFLIVLGVGFGQLFATAVVPLFTFWQFWANKVIPVFFGEQLGRLLSFSNTWFSYYSDDTAALRMFSLLPDSHSFALFVVLGLGVAAAKIWILQESNGFLESKWLWGVVGMAGLLALVLSGTRGVWVAYIGVVIVAVAGWGLTKVKRFLESKVSILNRWKHGASIVLLVGVVLILLFPISVPLLRISIEGDDANDISSFRRARSSFDIGELSVRGRLEIWQATLQSFMKRPLHGVGYGNFATVLDEQPEIARFGASAHSLYFNVIAETGLVGGVLFVTTLAGVGWKALRRWQEGLLPVSFVIVLLWAYIYGLFDVVLLNDRVLLLFLTFVGLVYATGANKINHVTQSSRNLE